VTRREPCRRQHLQFACKYKLLLLLVVCGACTTARVGGWVIECGWTDELSCSIGSIGHATLGQACARPPELSHDHERPRAVPTIDGFAAGELDVSRKEFASRDETLTPLFWMVCNSYLASSLSFLEEREDNHILPRTHTHKKEIMHSVWGNS
jgi:hypothetical protein